MLPSILCFWRYLLLYLPDTDAAIREMLRVTKSGEDTIAFEPDGIFDLSDPHNYPHNPGLETITFHFNNLFARPGWAASFSIVFMRPEGASCKPVRFSVWNTATAPTSASIGSLLRL